MAGGQGGRENSAAYSALLACQLLLRNSVVFLEDVLFPSRSVASWIS